MKNWAFVLGGTALLAGAAMVVTATGTPAEAEAAAPAPAAKTAYDFTMTRIDGKPLPLAQYRGKVLLVVNTASFCGLTPQYEGLQKLQAQYAAKGFTVIGVPSGDFMSQEYDDNGKIKEFCETKFGVTFPLTERVSVKGPQAAPFFRWAKAELPANNEPQWNFHKFLVGRDGKLVAGFPSRTLPESAEVTRAIERALG